MLPQETQADKGVLIVDKITHNLEDVLEKELKTERQQQLQECVRAAHVRMTLNLSVKPLENTTQRSQKRRLSNNLELPHILKARPRHEISIAEILQQHEAPTATTRKAGSVKSVDSGWRMYLDKKTPRLPPICNFLNLEVPHKTEAMKGRPGPSGSTGRPRWKHLYTEGASNPVAQGTDTLDVVMCGNGASTNEQASDADCNTGDIKTRQRRSMHGRYKSR